MAILSTPQIASIDAFDPSSNQDIAFYYTGSQSVKNRAVITDNSTYEIVYDRTISTLKLSHTIPANVCKPGKQYLIQIQVFDAAGNSSNLSDEVLFYCFTTPTLTLNTIENPHRAASITLTPTYYQTEGEGLKTYQYMLYDYAHNMISSSDVYYGDVTSHTFYGLENNTQYYVRCIAVTNHGMSLDTEEQLVNVIYNTIPANILFQVENHPCSGYISLITNMIIIGYELENDNYRFNPDGSVTLWNNSLTYKGGYSVDGDFALYIDAKELPLGTFLRTEDDKFTLSIVNVCDAYYCEFKSGDYVLYAELPQAQLATVDETFLVNELDQKIEIISMSYNNDTYVIFELKRINNIYSLKAYYKADA